MPSVNDTLKQSITGGPLPGAGLGSVPAPPGNLAAKLSKLKGKQAVSLANSIPEGAYAGAPDLSKGTAAAGAELAKAREEERRKADPTEQFLGGKQKSLVSLDGLTAGKAEKGRLSKANSQFV